MAVYTVPPSLPPRLARWRINAVLLMCVVFAAANSHKLFQVQVVQHEQLASLAASEFQASRDLLPHRGVIRDSAGGILAMNVDRDTLSAAPRLINDDPADANEADKLALLLAPLVGKSPTDVKQLLLTPDKEYVVIGRRLSPEASEQVRELKNSALSLDPEPVRVYPHGSFAASVVGVANHENVGISGVEGYNDGLLAGVPGTLDAEVDSASNPIWIKPPVVQQPRDGADITLTIDPAIQRIAEEELTLGIEKHGASGGSITILDPDTGAVLGMASWPFFDPNRYLDYEPEVFGRNAAISDQYEPGSTFKAINLAIGLNAGAYTTDTVVEDAGSIARAPGCCANWNGAGHAPMNPANVIFYSSNVGALQFAEIAGEETYYKGIQDFGYGEPTGIELGGEEAGIVQWPETTADWRPIVLSTNGYGQGISVTPLQHVRGIAAIANGGKLMRPYIIKEWCEKGECHATEPKLLREVAKPAVTEAIAAMMVRVANGNYAFGPEMWYDKCLANYDSAGSPGTGVALIPGYNVAAKTGTSSIPDGNGGYENATMGSIAGFAPAEKPAFAVLVKLDRTKDIWGVSAIPVYARTMGRLLTHAHIPPNPDLVNECQK